MAYQAHIYINNSLMDDIQIVRERADGSRHLEVTIASGYEEMIFLACPEEYLIIYPPSGMDPRGTSIRVNSDDDLAVSWSQTDSNWTIQLESNDLLPSGVPTTVNITIDVGEVEA